MPQRRENNKGERGKCWRDVHKKVRGRSVGTGGGAACVSG